MTRRESTGRAISYQLRGLVEGEAAGQLVVMKEPLSFYGDIDPHTGRLYDGRSTVGRIIVTPGSRGSTVGPYIAYQLAKNKKKPAAIILATQHKPDPILVAACVLAEIPLAQGPIDMGQLADNCHATLYVKPPQAKLDIKCP